jgi:Flp pilus assembly protein TadD
MRNSIFSLVVPLCIGLLATPVPDVVQAQTEELRQARDLATTGYYDEADALYTLVIAQHPENMDAHLGRAYNHSWHQNLPQARLEFEHVLSQDGKNKLALIGLGYTLAWAEEYQQAIYPFLRAQQHYPGDPEVDKGLAYVNLWRHRPETAKDMFSMLQSLEPENPEYYIALAYCNLQMYRTREARAMIRHAISLDPGDAGKKLLLKDIDRATPFMEVDVWAGHTDVADESRFGLRSIGLSIQATRRLRPFFIYDNTLTLDNLGYLLNRESVDTYFAGALMAWSKRHASRLQYGFRDFGGEGGSLFMGEHVYAFRNSVIGKGGFLVGEGQPGETTWMLYAGTYVPLGRGFAVEPVYYITDPSGPDGLEHRISAMLRYQLRSGMEISAGGVYGKANGTGDSGAREVTGAHGLVVVPVHRMLWLQGALRYENGVLGDYFIASAGIKLRFER